MEHCRIMVTTRNSRGETQVGYVIFDPGTEAYGLNFAADASGHAHIFVDMTQAIEVMGALVRARSDFVSCRIEGA